jgi:hypothetical protein
MLVCFWDLNDLTAWGNCSVMWLPENQKECSVRRATTKRIISYLYINKGSCNTSNCLQFNKSLSI